MPMTYEKCLNASTNPWTFIRRCEFCGLPARQAKTELVYHSGSRFSLKSHWFVHRKCEAFFRLASRLYNDEERGKAWSKREEEIRLSKAWSTLFPRRKKP